MKIIIKENDRYYKDKVGQQFDVIEKFGLLSDGFYFIKGRENEVKANWFSKDDCEIIDENYLAALETLRISERLEYYNARLRECNESIKNYENELNKGIEGKFKNQNKMLLYGALANSQRIQGMIELLISLKGNKIL